MTLRSSAAGIILILYIGLLPLLLFLAPAYTDHDLERMAQVVGLGLVIVISGLRSRIVAEFRLPISKFLTAALVAFLATSYLTHIGPMALREFALVLVLIATVFASSSIFKESGDVLPLKALVLVCAPYALLVALVYSLALASGDSILVTELFPGFSNYRFFSHVQTVTIPLLALAAACPALSAIYRSCARLTLVSNFAFLYFCSGRATMLGVAVAGMFGAITFGKESKSWTRELCGGALIGAVLYVTLFMWIPSLLGTNLDAMTDMEFARGKSIEARWYLWGLALEDLLASPIFGIGPMGFAKQVNFEAAHPHNIYLQIAAEWGLPSLVLLLAAGGLHLIRIARIIRISSDLHHSAVGAALLATTIAVLVDGALSGNFVMPMPQTWIACLFGWTVAWVRGRSEAPAGYARDKWIGCVMWLVPTMCAGFLFITCLPEFLDLQHRMQLVRDAAPTPRDNPRFWSDGWYGDGADRLPHEHLAKPPYFPAQRK